MAWEEVTLAYQTYSVLVEAISHEGSSGASPTGASSGLSTTLADAGR
jgi:hypothetical protein